MYWVLLVIIIFIACDTSIICYWRDNQNIDLSIITISTMLIGLPFVIICGLYLTVQLIKGIKNKVTKSKDLLSEEKHQEDSTALDRVSDCAEPKIYLFILEKALVTPLGHHIETISAELKSKKVCEPDSVLIYQENYPYLSQRIESLSQTAPPQNSVFKQELTCLVTDRSQRMEKITAQLLAQFSMVLQSIPLKKRYTEEVISDHQVRLHPEWLSSKSSKTVEEPIYVYRPSPSLRILYILPKHLNKEEQDALLHILQKRLKLMDITEEYDVIYDHADVENSEDTQTVIHNALQQHLDLDHAKTPQLLLVMGIDSWIDQALLDQKFKIEGGAVEPSEGGFAILFSDQNRTTDIEPLACVPPPCMYKRSFDDLNYAIEKFQQKYDFNKNDRIIEEDEILVVDHTETHTQALIELNDLSNRLKINRDQILSLSPILNDTNTMLSGCSLIFAIQKTIQQNKNTLLLHNAGQDCGTYWMVMPFVASHHHPNTEEGC